MGTNESSATTPDIQRASPKLRLALLPEVFAVGLAMGIIMGLVLGVQLETAVIAGGGSGLAFGIIYVILLFVFK